jgi:PEP-CTERM motif
MVVSVFYKSDVFNNHKFFYSLVIGFLAFAYSLATSSLTYASVNDFNNLLTASQGYTADNSFKSSPFSQREATGSDRAWMIARSYNSNLSGSSGDGQYIGSIRFDFTPAAELQTESASDIGRSELTDVASVPGISGTGQSGLIEAEISNQLGKGKRDSLSDNDWVKWSNSGLSSTSSLTSKYLHLPGILAKYPASAEPVIAYPVPEPETYAMLLAGLALIAFTARRRNNGFSN